MESDAAKGGVRLCLGWSQVWFGVESDWVWGGVRLSLGWSLKKHYLEHVPLLACSDNEDFLEKRCILAGGTQGVGPEGGRSNTKSWLMLHPRPTGVTVITVRSRRE